MPGTFRYFLALLSICGCAISPDTGCANPGDHRTEKRQCLRVSENRRYLQYENGVIFLSGRHGLGTVAQVQPGKGSQHLANRQRLHGHIQDAAQTARELVQTQYLHGYLPFEDFDPTCPGLYAMAR